MAKLNEWRFEACNPTKSPQWLPLFKVGEEELKASLELRDELNKINSPVVLRVIRSVRSH